MSSMKLTNRAKILETASEALLNYDTLVNKKRLAKRVASMYKRDTEVCIGHPRHDITIEYTATLCMYMYIFHVSN